MSDSHIDIADGYFALSANFDNAASKAFRDYRDGDMFPFNINKNLAVMNELKACFMLLCSIDTRLSDIERMRANESK